MIIDMLIKGYDRISEEVIRSMSHEELIEAVLRMFNVREENAENWRGSVYLPDDLADAFRARN